MVAIRLRQSWPQRAGAGWDPLPVSRATCAVDGHDEYTSQADESRRLAAPGLCVARRLPDGLMSLPSTPQLSSTTAGIVADTKILFRLA